MPKIDHTLGKRVQAHLKRLGIETPMRGRMLPGPARRQIKSAVEQIMTALNLDMSDDSLKDTPQRVADMFIDETFRGLDYHHFPKATMIENKMHCKDEFVVESGIQVDSVCEHHLVTIDGLATVAYVPKDKVIGLSKMNRIVDFFARRPQVQERLTAQIAETIAFLIETTDVAVCINAVHYCVKARGVRDVKAVTTTFHGTGRFADIHDPIRREFMERSRA